MSKIIKEIQDSNMKSWTRLKLQDDEWGFSGQYINKDLGICNLFLTQFLDGEYALILDVFVDGREYTRQIYLKKKCTYRFAALHAKKFLEELLGEKQ